MRFLSAKNLSCLAQFVTLFGLLVSLATPSWAETTAQSLANARAEITAGKAAVDSGMHELAVQHYSFAIRSGELSGKELSSAFTFRATSLAVLGQNERAIGGFTDALGLDPENVEAWLGRAAAHNAISQFENAINDLREIQELGVESAEAEHIWSHAYIGLGDTEWVRAPLRAAIKIDPNIAHYWYDLGVSNDGRAYIRVAADNYMQALYLDPGYLEARKKLAIAERQLDWLDEGKELFSLWRRLHEREEFMGENLAGAELQGADLSGRDLNGSKLNGANLRAANLRGAKLVVSA